MKMNCHFTRIIQSVAAIVISSSILISSLAGCSSKTAKQQMQTISDTYRAVESQIASSLNPAPKKGSLPKNSASPSSKTVAKKAETKLAKNSSQPSVPAKSDVQTVRKISATPSTSATPKKSIPSGKATISGSYSAVSQSSSYQHLTAQAEKGLYSLIDENVCEVALQKDSSGYYPVGQVSVSGQLPEMQIRVALTAYLDDHPQIFWLAQAYSYGYQDGHTILQLYSVYSPEQCNTAIQRLNSTVTSIMHSIPSGLSQFDREEYLFNYIVSHCTYDDAAVTDSSRWQSFTAYGALIYGTAVCEGYSRAMQLLAGYAGITCTLIRGSSGGVGHMWNAVQINGAWYHIDVTWCDNSMLIYNYYNINDTVIRQTHSVGPSVSSLSENEINSGDTEYNIYLPSCNSISQNYFRVKGIPVTTLGDSSDSAVIHSLAAQLKIGKKSIGFLVCGSYNSLVSGMMTSTPYKMSYWLSAAEKESGRNLDISKTNYVTDQADSGITIQVTYS